MIKIYNNDYLETIKNIPDNSIDLIVTDPPYLHEKGGRGKMLLGASLDRTKFNMKELGNFGEKEIFDFLSSTKRIMKKENYYIFCSEKQLFYYMKYCVENKLKYNVLTWNKPLSVTNRERYSTNIEYIIRIYTNGCALNKLDFEIDNKKTKYYSKYKTYNQIRGKNKLHPSEKPVEMLCEFIELSSLKNQIVLDPFMGSGSTGVACINTNRKFVGIELNKQYFLIAKERLEQHGN